MRPTHLLPLLVAVLLGTSLGLVSEALAQRVSPTEGIRAPNPTLVDRDDALSLELNPAGLAHTAGASFSVLHARFDDDLREGTGVFLGLSPDKGFGLGYGVQFLDAGLLEDGYRKHTLGAAFGDTFSLGLNYNFLGSNESQTIDDFSSWDLGFQYKPGRYFSLGATIRDVNSPFFRGVAVDPTYGFGAALRFWDDRIRLEDNLTLASGSDTFRNRVSLSVELLNGVTLFGNLEQTRNKEERSNTSQAGDATEVTQIMAGVSISTGALDLTGAGAFSGDSTGYSVAATANTASRRSIVPEFDHFQKIHISGNPPERETLGFFSGESPQNTFYHLAKKLRTLRHNPSVKGVIVEIDGVSMGYAQLWEIREELSKMREEGKATVALLKSTSHRDYYLGSAAEHVFMTPSTTFSARGLALTSSYYRGALDKLGVKADFVRIAEYKSAPESYTREAPSEAAEESLNAFLDAVWQHQLAVMSKDRGLPPSKMEALINTAPHNPDEALKAKLVDRIIYSDELKDQIKELYPKASIRENHYQLPSMDPRRWGQNPRVAVLHVDGNIVSGGGGVNPLLGDVMTGDATVKSFSQWAERNANVKAVVVRIDSPGGSAIASDRIYRHLRKLSEKKPVIVSLGDIAASGGYYTAAAGQEILCAPTTLTGSIGIFSGKFALDGLFAKVGLSTNIEKRGDRADLYDTSKPWSPEERKAIYHQMEYLYELFLSQVSATRNMDRDAVHKVAKGRIWAGSDAIKTGLCDRPGGILDAIDTAAVKAGLSIDPRDPNNFEVYSVPSSRSLPLVNNLPGVSAGLLGAPDLAENATAQEEYRAYAPLRRLLGPIRTAATLGVTFEDGEPLALMPFEIVD